MFISLFTVISVYVLANLAYFAVLSPLDLYNSRAVASVRQYQNHTNQPNNSNIFIHVDVIGQDLWRSDGQHYLSLRSDVMYRNFKQRFTG